MTPALYALELSYRDRERLRSAFTRELRRLDKSLERLEGGRYRGRLRERTRERGFAAFALEWIGEGRDALYMRPLELFLTAELLDRESRRVARRRPATPRAYDSRALAELELGDLRRRVDDLLVEHANNVVAEARALEVTEPIIADAETRILSRTSTWRELDAAEVSS